jgi:hypothetical protein
MQDIFSVLQLTQFLDQAVFEINFQPKVSRLALQLVLIV